MVFILSASGARRPPNALGGVILAEGSSRDASFSRPPWECNDPVWTVHYDQGGVQLKTINPLIGPRPVGRASPNRRPIRGGQKIKNIWRCYQSGLLVRAQLVFYTKCVCG